MKQNHFFIPYLGNKRKEVEKLFEIFKENNKNIKYIIEPFCGSCAVSYYISTKEPKKYTYILNDNSKNLINLLSLVKDGTNEEIENFEDEINIELNNIKKLIEKNYSEAKSYYNKNIKNDFVKWFIHNKYFFMRPSLFPYEKDKNRVFSFKKFEFKNIPFYNFLKNENIFLTCNDAVKIYNNYKNNIECFLFIDPPYILCNGSNIEYENAKMNIYKLLYDEIPLNNNKSFIICIFENMWIIKLLFKFESENNIMHEYEKKYSMKNIMEKKPNEILHGRKTTHILLTNIKK